MKTEFDSVREALEYVNVQTSPIEALMTILRATIEAGEIGFSIELIEAYDSNDCPSSSLN